MSLIKYRDGYTPTGRETADFLQTSYLEHVTKRNVDSLARRNGDFTNVYRTDARLAHVFSLGRNAALAWQTRRAQQARGRFGNVGEPIDSGLFVRNLSHYGHGMGINLRVFAADGGPATPDIAGNDWFTTQLIASRTRNGVTMVDHYALDVIWPAFLLGAAGADAQLCPGGWWDNAGTPTFYAGLVMTQMVSTDQPAHKFLRDDGTAQSFGATLGFANAAAWRSRVSTLAPGVLLKTDWYLRSTNPAYTVAPLAVFTISHDAGATWSVCPAPSLLAAELDSVAALSTSIGDVDTFNAAATYLRIITAPLSRVVSVVAACVPYMDGTTLKCRVKMGTIDSATGAMTGGVVLADDTPANASLVLKDLLATRDGVLVSTRPLVPDAAVWQRPAKIQVTTDGAALTDVGMMPLNENQTGVVRALSRTVLVAPGFEDGQHRLYQTRDFGATWMVRAIISADGVAPTLPGDTANLADFGDVAFLRNNDVDANAFPATPWLTDIRIDPP